MLAGLYDINPTLLELMKSIRANKWQIFLKIRVPNALPYLMDGMKIALPLSVVGAIVGEFIGAKAGMGNLILITQTALNTSLTFAALVTITLVSLLLFYVVSWFDRRFIWWRAV